MSSSADKMVDVLVGSSRTDFLEIIKTTLRGYYPYHLQQFLSVESLIDKSGDENFRPILALIDGQDGTQKTAEWVQTTKMNYPNCPLIVLHSVESALDFNLLKKNGANEIMHINFDREFLSDMVLQLAPIDMEGDHIPITALMPVDLRDIEADVNINFDVYVHLPANHRSVVLRRQGDVIDQRHVDKFKNLNQQMYVKKTQRDEFFEYARTVLSLRNVAFPISMTEKFHRSMRTIYDFMSQFLNGSSTDYSEGKQILDKCKSIVADLELNKTLTGPEIFEEVSRYCFNLRSYYHDCLCVAAYAAYFAQLLDWTPDKREAAAIAGLLHNIGLAQLPARTGAKTPEQLNDEEVIEYKLYPERSILMVKSKKVPISSEVSEGIGQHRENTMGTGFPKGLSAKELSLFGKLLSIAYKFHELTALKENQSLPTLNPSAAMAQLRDNAISEEANVDLLLVTQLFKKFKK